MRNLKVAIYIGKGASHSWIWFVNTLDRYGFRNIQFLQSVAGLKADVLVISGGDPFSVFSHIGRKGISRIRSFIEEGGTYIGICAGAYFALKFHENPYPWLNMVEGEISNFSVNPPPNRVMAHKYTVPYREGAVFHPVREDVLLYCDGKKILAPLYGGPGMQSQDAECLAVYKEFTEKTLFLCERKAAEDTLLEKMAVIQKRTGKGTLLIFGPHFEHPYFTEANKELVRMLSQIHPRGFDPEIVGEISPDEKRGWVKEMKRWVSNGRLAAFGLENFQWKIGEKIYDPERLAYFFETSFGLIKFFEREETIYIEKDLPRRARELALATRKLGPSPQDAEALLEGLKSLTSSLYSVYFSTLQLQPAQTL